MAPFYRSIATCLTFGMSPRDILTAQYATAADPSSGGRQMPGHYGDERHTQTHLRVEKIDADRNLIYVRGSVSGKPGGIVIVRKQA